MKHHHSEHEEGDMTMPSDRNDVDKANGQTKLQVNERIMCRSLFDIFINKETILIRNKLGKGIEHHQGFQQHN